MSEFLNCFDKIDDPRTGNATRHLFSEIMFIGFLCVLCGGKTGIDMADFAEAKQDILREFLKLPYGPPSHDTFSRLFRALDPKSFQFFFTRFTADFRARRECLEAKGAIAIDGKTVHRSFDHASNKSALNMVSAWAHEERLTLGCTGAGKGGDEIIALRRLVELLDIKGRMITADALHCQRETCQTILKNGGDYCISLKANQRTLYNNMRTFIRDQHTETTDVYEDSNNDHGRLETRITRIYTNLGTLREVHHWPGLKAVATVTATRGKDGQNQTNTRLFLLSKILSAQDTAILIRGHWAIENSLHWVLDVAMDEDGHRARKDNAPLNFAILRRVALNVIKADTSKGSNRVKFKRAGWNNKFLRKIIAQI